MERQLLTDGVLVGVDSDKVYVAIKVCYFLVNFISEMLVSYSDTLHTGQGL